VKTPLFKTTIIAAWFLLLLILLGRSLFIEEIDRHELQVIEDARQERYYGVWFQHRRIGYVAETLKPDGSDVILHQKAHILLNVLETTQPIDMNVTARLDQRLVLKDFNFQFTSPFYTMQAEGYAEGNSVHFTLDTGHSIITDKVTLDGPPMLAVNDRSYLLKKLTQAGQKIKVPSFDPLTLSGREAVVTYHGQEKILIRKRVKQLHHFSEMFSGMRINFWVDDSGKVIKEESPAGFQFIAEPEFRAKDVVSSGNELLSAVAVPLTGKLPERGTTEVIYRLSFPPDIELDMQGGRQNVNGSLLRVTLEKMPATASGDNGVCNQPEFLQPSRYVQTDHQDIRDTALNIVGNETDPAVQVRLLADWIYNSLEKRPVLGLPDALTTLHNKQGDCNEHASLFAALARSLNIPTAIATGVTLQDKYFYYHAWNEVCLDGTWYSLDTTTNQLPADIFHLRFGKGDLDQHLQIGALLGNLKIAIVPKENTEQ